MLLCQLEQKPTTKKGDPRENNEKKPETGLEILCQRIIRSDGVLCHILPAKRIGPRLVCRISPGCVHAELCHQFLQAQVLHFRKQMHGDDS